MEYRFLGKTALRVSRLCFGTLTIGPLQANLSVAKGARLIELALDQGVNFVDTAELYGTYPHIRRAIRQRDCKPVIASKSYAHTREKMKLSLQRALDGMDLPAVDIFLLHEQESDYTLKGHREALDYLLEAKRDGLVRAVGFSCHTVAALRAALGMPEIDVVHPLVNIGGVGIRDGTVTEMLSVIASLSEKGVGIFAMKPLAGGHLIAKNEEALSFVRRQPQLDSIAVGMVTAEEINFNCAFFSGQNLPVDLAETLRRAKRRLQVQYWCSGCGSCVVHCPQDALKVRAGRAHVEQKDCILCGYCGAHCPDFCLKIY
ncbi:MAG: aldo/keto reductase [Clostridium sp.]|nr:aldo/keto reductase [Clostridium sp.]